MFSVKSFNKLVFFVISFFLVSSFVCADDALRKEDNLVQKNKTFHTKFVQQDQESRSTDYSVEIVLPESMQKFKDRAQELLVTIAQHKDVQEVTDQIVVAKKRLQDFLQDKLAIAHPKLATLGRDDQFSFNTRAMPVKSNFCQADEVGAIFLKPFSPNNDSALNFDEKRLSSQKSSDLNNVKNSGIDALAHTTVAAITLDPISAINSAIKLTQFVVNINDAHVKDNVDKDLENKENRNQRMEFLAQQGYMYRSSINIRKKLSNAQNSVNAAKKAYEKSWDYVHSGYATNQKKLAEKELKEAQADLEHEENSFEKKALEDLEEKEKKAIEAIKKVITHYGYTFILSSNYVVKIQQAEDDLMKAQKNYDEVYLFNWPENLAKIENMKRQVKELKAEAVQEEKNWYSKILHKIKDDEDKKLAKKKADELIKKKQELEQAQLKVEKTKEEQCAQEIKDKLLSEQAKVQIEAQKEKIRKEEIEAANIALKELEIIKNNERYIERFFRDDKIAILDKLNNEKKLFELEEKANWGDNFGPLIKKCFILLGWRESDINKIIRRQQELDIQEEQDQIKVDLDEKLAIQIACQNIQNLVATAVSNGNDFLRSINFPIECDEILQKNKEEKDYCDSFLFNKKLIGISQKPAESVNYQKRVRLSNVIYDGILCNQYVFIDDNDQCLGGYLEAFDLSCCKEFVFRFTNPIPLPNQSIIAHQQFIVERSSSIVNSKFIHIQRDQAYQNQLIDRDVISGKKSKAQGIEHYRKLQKSMAIKELQRAVKKYQAQEKIALLPSDGPFPYQPAYNKDGIILTDKQGNPLDNKGNTWKLDANKENWNVYNTSNYLVNAKPIKANVLPQDIIIELEELQPAEIATNNQIDLAQQKDELIYKQTSESDLNSTGS